MLKVPSIIDRIAYSTNIDDLILPDGDIRKKYLRIHFVDGEYRDLTNTDIIQESFNFTESLCSSDSLKFGLCEASEVTFEVVGIPNITGSKIQVFYEIDVSDLDSTYGCAGRYISDSPEGVDLDEHNCNRTIGDEVARGVYSIPIGIFTVIEAGRSKSDMTHRSIRAITKVFESNDDMTSFELWRIAQFHKQDSFKMKIPHYIDAQLGTIDMNKYSYDTMSIPKTDGKVSDSCYKIDTSDKGNKFYLFGNNITNNHIYIALGNTINKGKNLTYSLDNPDNPSGIWDVEEKYTYAYYSLCNKYTVYNIVNEFDWIYDQTHPGLPYYMIEDKSGSFDRFYDAIKNFIYNANYTNVYGEVVYPFRVAYSYFENITSKKKEEFRRFYNTNLSSFGVRYSNKVGSSFSIEDSPYIFPYDSTMKDNKTTEERTCGRIVLPTSLYFSFNLYYDGAVHIFNCYFALHCPNSPIRGLTASSESWIGVMPYYYRRPDEPGNTTGYDVSLKFGSTLTNKSAKTYKYSFYNAFTMRDIINGYLEINAKFGHQARNGKYEYVELPSVTTRAMYRSEFEKLYYDEFDIDDIGYVIYKYKKNKDDKEVQVIFDLKNGGTSVYDMTDNSIFSILDDNDSISDSDLKKKIEKFITDYFRPHLGVIHYYPSEITMHSKPYLEPGDRYAIRNGSEIEDSFYTYNLNQTISGIQMPKTEMSSTTGIVIDGAALGVEEDDDDT